MPVFRKRNRIVSFRVSEEEFEMLQRISQTQGAHSLSDYARCVTCRTLDDGVPSSESGFCPHLQSLQGRIEQLGRDVDRLSRQVRQ